MHEALLSFPVVVDIPIAWGEMDALQHVNNIVYFRYFESGRIAYFDRLGYFPHMLDTGVGPILASTHCTFKFPLTYPDTLWVGTKTTALGEDRFTMRQVAVSQRHNRVAAEGESLIVSYDYKAGRKAPLPDGLRRLIVDLEGLGPTA